MTIAVIGLGYVGLPLVVEFGKHRRCIGFDISLIKGRILSTASTRRGNCPTTT